MRFVMTAEDCVIVAKDKTLVNDKEYCNIGVSQGKKSVGTISLPAEDYDKITDSMFYKPLNLELEYVETRTGAAFLKFFGISEVTGKK